VKYPTIDQEYCLVLEVTTEHVRQFAELSGDKAPLHIDDEFARRHGFSGTVVHGALLGSFVSQLVGVFLPGPNSIMERMDLAFRRPCIAPCELHLKARVKQVSEAVSSVMMEISVSDAGANILASGKTWHKILQEVQTD
jgi:3-hydroxybutyryl-CoA dehydratase